MARPGFSHAWARRVARLGAYIGIGAVVVIVCAVGGALIATVGLNRWLGPDEIAVECREETVAARTVENCNRYLAAFDGAEPQLATYLRIRGRAYEKLQKYDLALADLNRSLELDPLPSEAYFDRGRSNYHKGLYQRAIADFRMALSAPSGKREVFQYLAKTYSKTGEPELAKEALKNALIADPDFAGGGTEQQAAFDRLFGSGGQGGPNLAVTLERRCRGQDPQDEVEACTTLIDKTSGDRERSDVYVARARAQLRRGSLDDAISDFTIALDLNHENATAFYGRGYAHYRRRQFAMAVADMDEAIRLSGSPAGAYAGRGWARYGMGDYQQAIRDFDKAIELNPKSGDAYNGRAWSYARAGDVSKALASMEAAIKADPSYELSQQNLLAELKRKNAAP